jgi:hypothetical protein
LACYSTDDADPETVLKLSQLAREIVATQSARLKLGLFNVGTALLLLATAAVISLVGAVFLLYGLYQTLLQFTPPWTAGGIITLLTLLVALILLFWARRRLSTGRVPAATAHPPASEAAEEVRRATERGISAGETLRHNLRPIDLVLSAFIAGMVLSRGARPASPRDRRGRDRGP